MKILFFIFKMILIMCLNTSAQTELERSLLKIDKFGNISSDLMYSYEENQIFTKYHGIPSPIILKEIEEFEKELLSFRRTADPKNSADLLKHLRHGIGSAEPYQIARLYLSVKYLYPKYEPIIKKQILLEFDKLSKSKQLRHAKLREQWQKSKFSFFEIDSDNKITWCHMNIIAFITLHERVKRVREKQKGQQLEKQKK